MTRPTRPQLDRENWIVLACAAALLALVLMHGAGWLPS